MPEKIEELALDLYRIGAVKFGDFQLKNGHRTPIYCDFRDIFSYPDVWLKLIDIMIEKLTAIGPKSFDALCGVPYTALPLAALIGAKQRCPVLLKRKERKTYGTGKLIEGVFSRGQRVLVIEDVVTTGSSIIETARDLRAEGLVVQQVLAVLDREQSGQINLEKNGIEFFYIFRLVQLLEILHANSLIGTTKIDSVREYLQNNKQAEVQVQKNRLNLSFEMRRECCKNELGRKLFDIMISKQTNLCVAVDLIECDSVLKCIEKIGSFVCIVKIHCDIIEDFNFDFVQKLKQLANQMNFLIMEDRKFADIGQIVQWQFMRGFHRIGSWADLITIHAISGPEVLKAIEKTTENRTEPLGVFVVAELSTSANLTDKTYAQKAIENGKQFDRIVCGFVGQNRLVVNDPGLIQLTPGVQIDTVSDGLGQMYNDPNSIVTENGADIAVVGRGIVRNPNVEQAAANYRKLLWAAYEKRAIF